MTAVVGQQPLPSPEPAAAEPGLALLLPPLPPLAAADAGLGAAAAAAPAAATCWGGQATCLDAWTPAGVVFRDDLVPFYLLVVAYVAVALILCSWLSTVVCDRALRRVFATGSNKPGSRAKAAKEPIQAAGRLPDGSWLPINAFVGCVLMLICVSWWANLAFVVDWGRGALDVQDPAAWGVAQVQAIVLLVAYAVELSSKVCGFTWLLYSHHILTMVDIAYMLTCVRNPYSLFMGWLFLGHVSLEFAVSLSLCCHELSKIASSRAATAAAGALVGSKAAGGTDASTAGEGGIAAAPRAVAALWQARSTAITRGQLWWSLAHNVVFQVAVNAYLGVHWHQMSVFFCSSFVVFNCICLLEVAYCIHCTAGVLVRKGAATACEARLHALTRPIKLLATGALLSRSAGRRDRLPTCESAGAAAAAAAS